MEPGARQRDLTYYSMNLQLQLIFDHHSLILQDGACIYMQTVYLTVLNLSGCISHWTLYNNCISVEYALSKHVRLLTRLYSRTAYSKEQLRASFTILGSSASRIINGDFP